MFELNQRNGWHLRSRGPDRQYARRSAGWEDFLTFRGQQGTGTSGNGGINILYDPTNGTVSFGDVVYFANGGQQNK
jgi:hypothetical protein